MSKRTSTQNEQAEERFELEKSDTFHLFLVISKFNGVYYILIRNYYQGKTHTRYGICFTLTKWYEFVKFLEGRKEAATLTSCAAAERPSGVLTLHPRNKPFIVYISPLARISLKQRYFK